MTAERLAQIALRFDEAQSDVRESVHLAPYSEDIAWLLATARAGLADTERMDWLASVKGVGIEDGWAFINASEKQAPDELRAGIDAARSVTKRSGREAGAE